MCGRVGVVLDDAWLEAIQKVLHLNNPDWELPPHRWNLAPTQSVSVIRHVAGQPYTFRPLSWGLVPPWAKDPSIGQHCINARSETASQKPAFKHAWHHRRCLVPVSAWYEWREENGKKQPYLFRLKSGQAAMVAGLWETWQPPQGPELESFALLTCEAKGQAADIHHRMPVLLSPEHWNLWLGPDGPDAVFQKLMTPSAEELHIHPVSRRVNKAGEDGPELFEPLVEEPKQEKPPPRRLTLFG